MAGAAAGAESNGAGERRRSLRAGREGGGIRCGFRGMDKSFLTISSGRASAWLARGCAQCQAGVGAKL